MSTPRPSKNQAWRKTARLSYLYNLEDDDSLQLPAVDFLRSSEIKSFYT